MVASDGKRVSEPSHNGSPLGPKMGEPSAYVPAVLITKCETEPTGCATSWKQANSKQMEEVVANRQEILTLITSSEGR